MSGFVAISRKLFDHYLWTKRREFSEAEAWLDLIQSANWQPGRQRVKGKTFDVGRGELLAANRYLMERWGWKSLTKVQSFLRMLSDDGMIRSEALTVTSRITICNYETYNSLEVANKSQISRSEVAERSLGGRSEVAFEVKVEQVKQEEKEKQEERELTPPPSFFEKNENPTLPGTARFGLMKRIGSPAAQMWEQGEAAAKFDSGEHAALALDWMEHLCQKKRPLQSQQSLTALIAQFKGKPMADLRAVVQYSFDRDYPALYFDILTKPSKRVMDNSIGKIIDPKKFENVQASSSGLVKLK